MFLNGILLDITDYTATNGTTVVLTDAADANDEVVIIALDSFAIAELLRVTNVSASAGNNTLTVGANSGIGIGVAVPTTKLDVGGTIRLRNDTRQVAAALKLPLKQVLAQPSKVLNTSL